MRRRDFARPNRTRRLATGDPGEIDARYGLEPVWEPGSEAAGDVSPFVDVQCPHCGEHFDTAVDLSAGSFSYVEDCQVCCRPIELAGEADGEGALVAFTARREA